MSGVLPADARRREQRGWYWYDWANSVFTTSVVTVFLGPYLTDVAETAAGGPDGRLRPLGVPIDPDSLFPYLLSVAALLQVLVLPVIGALADRTRRKRELIGVLAYLGALATAGLALVAGGRYLLGAALFLVANTCFGASLVVYYSFLPEIAGPDERDEVSARGWAFGYLGGGLLLALNLGLFLGRGALGLTEGEAVRICFLSVAIWWAGFTLVPLHRLRNRPADPADPRAAGGSFRQLAATLRSLRAYPQTLLFLVAYLLFNDGIQTIIGLSAQYGDRELGLGRTVLISTILLVQFVAFGGALLLGRIAARVGAKRTILGSLAVWVGVLCLAFFLQRGSALQFYLLGVAIGVVLGGTQALTRSLFAQMTPRGKEAEYFGLYEISDKGTSWLGTFLFGLALQLTDSYRIAIVSLVVFFVAGAAVLSRVDVRRATLEARGEQAAVL
ncbi:MAG TPA: MFS transporter [Mycobacteriales bacterium]|nr:MFS transporter [Mycobacteriales bacterium]